MKIFSKQTEGSQLEHITQYIRATLSVSEKKLGNSNLQKNKYKSKLDLFYFHLLFFSLEKKGKRYFLNS